MTSSALDTLTELVRSFQIGSRQLFETAFQHHLAIALEGVRGDHYVDDSVDLVNEALERLFSENVDAEAARANLLGAIEALRDELSLTTADNDQDVTRASAS